MEQLSNNEYNILVVEDDKEIRDGIEIFLKSQGYHVYKAADGVEGLEVIGRETIHLAENIMSSRSSCFLQNQRRQTK